MTRSMPSMLASGNITPQSMAIAVAAVLEHEAVEADLAEAAERDDAQGSAHVANPE